MKITTERFELGNTYMISKLYVDGVYECYIMEDPLRDVKIHGNTAIPRGIYKIGTHQSPRFKMLLPMILDVPNFKYILIHSLNLATQTDGCLGPGSSIGFLGSNRAVLDSRTATSKLNKKIFDALKKGEKVTIELK